MKDEVPQNAFKMIDHIRVVEEALQKDVNQNRMLAFETRLHQLKLMIVRYERLVLKK